MKAPEASGDRLPLYSTNRYGKGSMDMGADFLSVSVEPKTRMTGTSGSLEICELRTCFRRTGSYLVEGLGSSQCN